jgi:Prokaryotic membrane lipoprotein lipid attachment site
MRRILIIAVAMLALAGCKNAADGDGIPSANGTATPSPTASFQPDQPAFIRCMRQHNVNLPDPVPNQQWRPDKPAGVTREQFETAVRACQSYLGEDLLGQPPSAEELEKLRAFAVCMREHGIEMTDPLPNGNMEIKGRLEFVTREQLNADPQFQAAEAACHHLLPVDEGKGKE